MCCGYVWRIEKRTKNKTQHAYDKIIAMCVAGKAAWGTEKGLKNSYYLNIKLLFFSLIVRAMVFTNLTAMLDRKQHRRAHSVHREPIELNNVARWSWVIVRPNANAYHPVWILTWKTGRIALALGNWHQPSLLQSSDIERDSYVSAMLNDCHEMPSKYRQQWT